LESKKLDYLSISQHKQALDSIIYRAIFQFEKETNHAVLDINVNRIYTRIDKTICTGVSIRIKKNENKNR